MYSPGDFLWMIADEVRVAAYTSALRALVRPGDTVLEIGAGFGFFSVLAARHGAGQVHAVDTNPAIHLGPHVAAANGCADRVTFHYLDATALELSRRADVVISDLRGPTPFSGRSLAVIIDARERLARPGATFIAASDTVFAAPCRAPGAFRHEVLAAHAREGLDLGAVERVVYDTPMRCAIDPDDLAAAGQPWCKLDYASLVRPDHDGEIQWTLERDARIDGIAVWFSTDLGAGIGFSSAPGSAVQSYRQTFLPLRTSALLGAGDRIRIRVNVRLVRTDYIWDWRAWTTPKGTHDQRELAHQNSLAEIVIDPAALRPVSG